MGQVGQGILSVTVAAYYRTVLRQSFAATVFDVLWIKIHDMVRIEILQTELELVTKAL